MWKLVFFLSLLSVIPAKAAISWDDFGGHAGLHWGYGLAENESGTVPVRQLNTFNVQAMPGYWVMENLLASLYAEYRFTGQNKKPSDVRDTNLKGNGFLLGLGVRYDWGKFKFATAVSFLGEYFFSKQNSDNKDTSLESPLGFHGFFGYNLYKNITADLIGSYVVYDRQEIDGTSVSLDNDEVSHWSIGLGASYLF